MQDRSKAISALGALSEDRHLGHLLEPSMEEAAPIVPGVAGDSAQAAGQVAPPDDSIVIHPHLYEPQAKPVPPVQLGKQLLRHLGQGEKATAKRYVEQLETVRRTLQSTLESTTMSEASVHSALCGYVAVLLGLVDAPGKQAAGEADGSADAAAAADDAGQQGVKGDSPLRGAVSFTWHDALVGSETFTHPDAVFELASVLIATSVWYMRRAASLCRDSASGVASPASMQANKLLRQAAGMLDYVQTWILPLLPAGASKDCDPQIVKGLSLLALADCQALTVLRAVQKGNQPVLIAGIAAGAVALYGDALQMVLSSGVPAAPNSKLAHYLRYKQASLQAYAHCFAGLAQWKGGQAGVGLRCLQEGQAAADVAKKAYQEYDKAAPATLTNAHRRSDEILQALLVDSRQRIQKENEAVFFQKVPQQMAEPPAPKRMVAPTPYVPPQPAAGVREGVASFAAAPAAVALEMRAPPVQGAPSTDAKALTSPPAVAPPAKHAEQEGRQEGCCCRSLRWLLFLIAFPLMLLISAVGIVLWVVLLPVKIICCPCGCLIQIIANTVEYLIKAPLHLILWATGKPWEPAGSAKQEKGKAEPPV